MAKLKPDYIEWVLKLNATQAQEEYHKLEKESKELKSRMNANRKEMAHLEAQGKKNSSEWKNLAKSNGNYSRQLGENRKKLEELTKRMDINSMSVSQLRKRMKELQTEFKNTSKATDPKRYKELRAEINRVQGAIDKANASARGLKGGFFSLTKMKQTLIGFFNGIGLTIVGLVTGAFSNAFNLIVDFEKANSRLASILGTTTKGISELTAGARQLGATTSYSAAQVTNLQIELAKLGFSKQQILDMEGAVLKFAKAVDTDLASASAFAGAALRIFGKDATQTEDVLATFAVATTKTALDFSKLATSLSIVGPVANSFGLSIEDTTALLGQLANAGFDASSAATATRNIILNLCDANGDLAKALGHPVKNAEDLASGLQKLNAEGVDLAKALDLTDKRSVAAFSTFLEQSGNLVTLRDSITGVTADFNEMSATMGDNVAGAMAGLRSAAEELVLKISSGTNGPIKDLIKGLTWLVQKTGDGIAVLSEFGKGIKAIVVFLISYKTAVLLLNKAKVAWIAITKSWNTLSELCKASMLKLTTSIQSGTLATEAATAATTRFNKVVKAVKWTSVIGGIIAFVSALVMYVKSKKEATAATKALKAAEEEATSRYAEQVASIQSLVNAASNENIALDERLKAVNRLNAIIPGYNAQIDKTTGKYKASTTALKQYLGQLEKKLRYEATEDEYKKLIAEEEKIRREKIKADKEAKAEAARSNENQTVAPRTFTSSGGGGGAQYSVGYHKAQHAARDYADDVNERYSDAKAATQELRDFIDEGLKNGTMVASVASDTADAVEDASDDISNVIGNVGSVASDTVDKIKALRAELKELRKADPQTNEEFFAIEAKKKSIRQQISALSGKNTKGKHTPGTYGEDSLDEVTADADDLHQKKLLEINKQKSSLPEYDIVINKNEELIRYSGDLIKALEALKAKTDATHTQTLDKIRDKENKIGQDMLAAQQEINKATAQKEQAEHEQRLAANQAFYDNFQQEIKRQLNDRTKTEGAAEVLLLAQKKSFHEMQLQELEDFKKKTEQADYLGDDQRRQNLEKINADIRSMQSQVLTDTGEFAAKLRELSTDTTSAAGIMAGYDAQRRNLETTYDAMIGIVGEGTEAAVGLEKEKQRRLAQLDFEQLEKQYELKEMTGLTWQDEYERELALLENYHAQGLIKEKDYQKKKLELGVNNAKRYFDYYAQLSGSMFQAIQDAEIAKSDAKYDVLIQQAKNNGEDTAELEQEKENKKLEIQKKYADVNFAIKISQIVADTAVAIMKAFADLGPIGGAVAAAMITATGVAQGIAAKAERDKIKNMQPGNVSGTKSAETPKAERVLTGYSDGGYTGDGGRYEVAGIVHKGEYVVPKPIMRDARVIDAVGMIEAIRLNRRGAVTTTQADGFADGGYTSGASDSGATTAVEIENLRQACIELHQAAKDIRAYIVYSDLEHASESMNRARMPFTRKRP